MNNIDPNFIYVYHFPHSRLILQLRSFQYTDRFAVFHGRQSLSRNGWSRLYNPLLASILMMVPAILPPTRIDFVVPVDATGMVGASILDNYKLEEDKMYSLSD